MLKSLEIEFRAQKIYNGIFNIEYTTPSAESSDAWLKIRPHSATVDKLDLARETADTDFLAVWSSVLRIAAASCKPDGALDCLESRAALARHSAMLSACAEKGIKEPASPALCALKTLNSRGFSETIANNNTEARTLLDLWYSTDHISALQKTVLHKLENHKFAQARTSIAYGGPPEQMSASEVRTLELLLLTRTVMLTLQESSALQILKDVGYAGVNTLLVPTPIRDFIINLRADIAKVYLEHLLNQGADELDALVQRITPPPELAQVSADAVAQGVVRTTMEAC
jgi:hypothetical protein